MKNKSLCERITHSIERWRMLSTPQIRELLSQEMTVNDQSLFTVLKRMRRASHIYSIRLGSLHLNFHPFWKKARNKLQLQPIKERSNYFRSSKLLHHHELTEIFLDWKGEFPHLEALPNISTHSDVASKSIGGKLGVPDLVIRLNPFSSLYIEYERTLKSSRRYEIKWWTYEDDPSVKTCLYWLEDPSHLPALEKEAETFFRRTIGREDFFLGFISTEAFKQNRFDASARLYSLDGCVERSLKLLLRPAPVAVQAMSETTNFPPQPLIIIWLFPLFEQTPLPQPVLTTGS
ncbi:MAG: hypothetical protein COV44_02950 [Deltaproteobacteria bacterium CG11_big_fil_rev_8_21_14_0_20_45_16]|nr:MAG: hypothetical protein COV44_02950 [Deltaproteobacteria bacterium CG11_big_fil_rev_8_21_14_0_20_45_16]